MRVGLEYFSPGKDLFCKKYIIENGNPASRKYMFENGNPASGKKDHMALRTFYFRTFV
jgi:hypothetical protein